MLLDDIDNGGADPGGIVQYQFKEMRAMQSIVDVEDIYCVSVVGHVLYDVWSPIVE